MPTSEHPEPKSPQAIKRDLGRWHLLSVVYMLMLVITIICTFATGWQGIFYINHVTGFNIFVFKPQQIPAEAHLYLTIFGAIFSFSVWRLSKITEKFLVDTAQKRRNEHPFYGKYIESKDAIDNL